MAKPDKSKPVSKRFAISPLLRRNGGLRKGTNGRASLLTPELQQRMVKVMREGHYAETVCDLVGLHYVTFNEWMRRGEEEQRQGYENGPYALFALAIKNASAVAFTESMRNVRSHKFNWQASAWFLERRAPEKYGQRQRFEHSGPQGGPIPHQHDLTRLSKEELRDLRKLVAKASEKE